MEYLEGGEVRLRPSSLPPLLATADVICTGLACVGFRSMAFSRPQHRFNGACITNAIMITWAGKNGRAQRTWQRMTIL
jgi:hypothetical protein